MTDDINHSDDSTNNMVEITNLPILSEMDLRTILNTVQNGGKQRPALTADKSPEETEDLGEESEQESDQEHALDKGEKDNGEEQEARDQSVVSDGFNDEFNDEFNDDTESVQDDDSNGEDDYELSSNTSKRKAAHQRARGGRDYVKVERPLSQAWPARRTLHFDIRFEPFSMENIEVDKQGAYNALKEVCQTLIVVADKQHKRNLTAEDEKVGNRYIFRIYCHTFEAVSHWSGMFHFS